MVILSAVPPQEQAKFGANRAAADHHRARGDLGERSRLAVGPERDAVQTVNGRDERLRPGRDDQVIGGQRPAVDFDLALAGDPRRALDHGRAGLLIALDMVAVVEVADHDVAVVTGRGPVELRTGHALGPVDLAFGFR